MWLILFDLFMFSISVEFLIHMHCFPFFSLSILFSCIWLCVLRTIIVNSRTGIPSFSFRSFLENCHVPLEASCVFTSSCFLCSNVEICTSCITFPSSLWTRLHWKIYILFRMDVSFQLSSYCGFCFGWAWQCSLDVISSVVISVICVYECYNYLDWRYLYRHMTVNRC